MNSWLGIAARVAWIGVAGLSFAGPVHAQADEAASAVSAAEDVAGVPTGYDVVAGAMVMDFKDSSPELRIALIDHSGMTVEIQPAGQPDAKPIRFKTECRHRQVTWLRRACDRDAQRKTG